LEVAGLSSRIAMSGRTGARESYERYLGQETDIRDHLPRLFEEARGTVLELGVRGGVSTSALLAGVEQRGGEVWSVDVDPSSSTAYAAHPLWHFVCSDSRDPAPLAVAGLPSKIDVLFVDTLHEYEHVREELAVWGPRVSRGGIVLVHDTDTFPEVRHAVEDYARRKGLHSEFLPSSNGLGVIYPAPVARPAGAVTVLGMIVRRLSRRAAAAAHEYRSAFFRRHPRLQRAFAKALRRSSADGS
jgi:Methyltransferase domain